MCDNKPLESSTRSGSAISLTGKCYRARWKRSLTEIESHNGEWTIQAAKLWCTPTKQVARLRHTLAEPTSMLRTCSLTAASGTSPSLRGRARDSFGVSVMGLGVHIIGPLHCRARPWKKEGDALIRDRGMPQCM